MFGFVVSFCMWIWLRCVLVGVKWMMVGVVLLWLVCMVVNVCFSGLVSMIMFGLLL